MVILSILLILIVLWIGILIFRSTQQRKILKQVKENLTEKGLSEVEEVTLGGIKQSILIQTADISKPVLLVLHGGPAMPFPGVSSRGLDYAVNLSTHELVKHFVVVFWDQRGTGRSYHKSIPKESIHIEQFISDAAELVDYLRNRFQQEKIYLAAISFGSLIGLSVASRYPEKIRGYIGIAQIVNWMKSDLLNYDWAMNHAKKTNNRKAIKQLTNVGRPPYQSFQQWGVLRGWIMKFGGLIYKNDQVKGPSLLNSIKTMFQSPDYKWKDIMNTIIKFPFSYSLQMIRDLSAVDFFRTVKQVPFPVLFVHGTHDFNVSGKILEEYYHELSAPAGKELHWLEKSAHIFHEEDAKVVEKLIIDFAHKQKINVLTKN